MTTTTKQALTVAVILAVLTAPVTGVGALTTTQSTPTVTIDAPDSIEAPNTATSPLVVTDVAPNDDIGAYELNITYNASAVSISASDSSQFSVTTNQPSTGVLTVVGYTSATDTPDGTLSLAALTITAERPVSTTNLSITVDTLADTDGNSIPYAVRDEPLAVSRASDTDTGDGSDGGSGGGGGGGGGGGSAGTISGAATGSTVSTTVGGSAVDLAGTTPGTPVGIELAVSDSLLSTDGVALSQMQFTPTGNIQGELSISASASANVAPVAADGDLGYVRIQENIDPSLVSSATFTIAVSKTRLQERNVAPENVAVYRYEDGSWNQLDTQLTRTLEDRRLYTVQSPGLSLYAISTKDASTQETTTTTTTGGTTTPAGTTTTAVTTTTQAPPGEQQQDDGGPPLLLVVLGVLVIVGLLLGLIYYYRT